MIAFVTLFLGLVLGPLTVELAVDPAVARVELRLDGRLLAERTSPPWLLPCDLGAELSPHELTAVAFDTQGRQVGLARQWLNLPRPPAEAGLVLERGPDGAARAARLNWESVAGPAPRAVSVTFDGRPLPVEDRRRIELPPHDSRQLHLLRVELDFSEAVASVVELAFGGTYADEVTTDLTAVPVLLERRRGEPPPVAGLRGWLLKAGVALEVVAVERGLAEAVVVRDEGSTRALERLQRQILHLLRGFGPGNPRGRDIRGLPVAGGLRGAMPLSFDQRVRLLWPFAQEQPGAGTRFALFSSSEEVEAREAGMYWVLSRTRVARPAGARQRLADAVAVAGLAAAGRGRRRAVVLVLSGAPLDASELPPAEVRRYLERLRVPFEVWALERGESPAVAAWAPVRDVSTAARLQTAVEELDRLLDRQRIVWVEGTHLPPEIALAPQATGFELAGE